MNPWLERWRAIVHEKKTQLCIGCDPTQPTKEERLAFCRHLIEKTAPHAAAIKINRQFIRDLSREETRALTDLARDMDCLVIDDSKIADIGSTNDAALEHARAEGFDLITQCPFPGNLRVTCAAGATHGLGVIPLVLMSNPEFVVMRQARIDDEPLPFYLARETGASEAAGFVVGAPSPANGITVRDLEIVREFAAEKLALVPGIGAQGGDARDILAVFGLDAMINVGRTIASQPDPSDAARRFQAMLRVAPRKRS